MNKKLRTENKNQIAILYSHLPNRVHTRKKTMQTIPLLGRQDGYKVFQDVAKTEYKFILKKNKNTNDFEFA